MLEGRKQQGIPESAQEACKRPAYFIDHKAKCKVYQETRCGVEICCFECVKRFICREFEGECDRYTRKTYKSCNKLIQKQRESSD